MTNSPLLFININLGSHGKTESSNMQKMNQNQIFVREDERGCKPTFTYLYVLRMQRFFQKPWFLEGWKAIEYP